MAAMPQTSSHPGVDVKEVSPQLPAIEGAETSTAVFVGRTPPREHDAGDGPWQIRNLLEFERAFGAVAGDWTLGLAVQDFFANGGRRAWVLRLQSGVQAEGAGAMGPPLSVSDYLGDAQAGSGLHALRAIDDFSLLCIPPDMPGTDTAPAVWQAALACCVQRRAMLLVDAPGAWETQPGLPDADALAALGLPYPASRNAALYFPRVVHGGSERDAAPRVPCGAVAGVYARTDSQRGVWKAPAGLEATLRGQVPARALSDLQQAALNPLAINCLRLLPQGAVLWGARTLAGADTQADDFKYVPVRRLALYLEDSLERGLAWTAFQPNGEALWARVRLACGAFMHGLFRQGAFQGTTPRDAYFVRCDASTTRAADIAVGVLHLQIGFAPLKPAEFVVLGFALAAVVPDA
jgi:phage tail sheath protein FI